MSTPTIKDRAIQQLVLSNERRDNVLAALLTGSPESILGWAKMSATEAALANMPFILAYRYHQLMLTYCQEFPYMIKMKNIVLEFNALISPVIISEGEDYFNDDV